MSTKKSTSKTKRPSPVSKALAPSHIMKSKLSRMALVVALLISLNTLAVLNLVQLNSASAATSPWNDTDWDGGSGTDYVSGSTIDDTTTGQVSLASNGEEFSNTGFETNLTSWSAPFSNTYAVDFDGSNEYLVVGDDDSLDFGTGDFSLSAWIKTDTISGGTDRVMSKGSSGWIGYGMSLRNDELRSSIQASGGGNQNDTSAVDTITTTSWYHLVIVFDRDNRVYGYIDGDEVINAEYDPGNDGSISSNYNLVIGAYTDGAQQFFNGKIDEVSIWNDDLSSAEVTELYNAGTPTDLSSHSASSDLVSWYRMGDDASDDLTGGTGTVIDQIGSNDGTPTNTESGDKVADAPGSSSTTITRDTSTTYNSSSGSAKVVTTTETFDLTESLNVGDTDEYNISTYAYTDGSEVTASDVQLVVNGSTISTTYTDRGSGWYQLTGTTTGTASSIAYGAQVKASKTVYFDDFSLSRYVTSGTLTSSIFNTEQSSTWGTATYTTSGTGTISVKYRTGNQADLSDATDFSSCVAVASAQDLSDNACVTDSHQYIQYQVALTATDTTVTPVFEDISIVFESGSSSVDSLSLQQNISLVEPEFTVENTEGTVVKPGTLIRNGTVLTLKPVAEPSTVSTYTVSHQKDTEEELFLHRFFAGAELEWTLLPEYCVDGSVTLYLQFYLSNGEIDGLVRHTFDCGDRTIKLYDEKGALVTAESLVLAGTELTLEPNVDAATTRYGVTAGDDHSNLDTFVYYDYVPGKQETWTFNADFCIDERLIIHIDFYDTTGTVLSHKHKSVNCTDDPSKFEEKETETVLSDDPQVLFEQLLATGALTEIVVEDTTYYAFALPTETIDVVESDLEQEITQDPVDELLELIFEVELTFGDRGAEVIRLQELLTGLGYETEADGIYGRSTNKSVRSFLRDR